MRVLSSQHAKAGMIGLLCSRGYLAFTSVMPYCLVYPAHVPSRLLSQLLHRIQVQASWIHLGASHECVGKINSLAASSDIPAIETILSSFDFKAMLIESLATGLPLGDIQERKSSWCMYRHDQGPYSRLP